LAELLTGVMLPGYVGSFVDFLNFVDFVDFDDFVDSAA